MISTKIEDSSSLETSNTSDESMVGAFGLTWAANDDSKDESLNGIDDELEMSRSVGIWFQF